MIGPKGISGPTDSWKGVGEDGKEYHIFINWYGNEMSSVAPKGLKYVEFKQLTHQELLKKAMAVVFAMSLKKDGFEILGSNEDEDKKPNFICRKDGQICLISVEGMMYPKRPVMNPLEKAEFAKFAKEKNARAFIGVVGFKYVSDEDDEPRFAYNGLEEITE